MQLQTFPSSLMLTLRSDELALFQSLSGGLRDGWQTEEEQLEAKDSNEFMQMRLELLHVRSTVLKDFVSKVKASKNPQEVAKLFAEMDLHEVEDADLAELFFALGPVPLTLIIKDLLSNASSDSDLQDLEALTGIRHSLLLSHS